MDKFDVKIHFPYATVILTGPVSEHEVARVNDNIRLGRQFSVLSGRNTSVTINPSMVTYVEATPNQPF